MQSGSWLSTCLVVGVAIGGIAAAGHAGTAGARGSAKALPDWSGVWICDATCFAASEDSFGTDGGRVPLTPKYLKLRADARAARAQQNLSFCLPAGIPGIQQHGVLHEYLIDRGRVTVLYEDGEVRRIYTDGRSHRPLNEFTASFMGDSIAHWEGGTLVVDTTGFPKGTLFQNHGLLATINTHLVERIFLQDKNHLRIDSVLTDPAIFARPYQYTRVYERSTLLMEEPQCRYANHDTGESIDLTPPPEDE